MTRRIAGSIHSQGFGALWMLGVIAVGALLVTAGVTAPDPPAGSASAPAVGAGRLVTVGSPLFLPAAAHVGGAANTDWRTDLEVYNSGTTPAQFEVALLPRDGNNSSPAAVPFSLLSGRSIRYNDILFSVFGFTGSAALRIEASAGEVTVTSRTFNQTDAGTYGQFIGGTPLSRAISYGQEGRIIQLSQSQSNDTGYRANVGFLNCTSETIYVQADMYLWDGVFLGTRNFELGPYSFIQRERIFRAVTQNEVSDGYVVVRTLTPTGKFFAYASVVDNRTGDPIYIPAIVLGELVPPTPTPSPTLAQTSTHTRTPTPTQSATSSATATVPATSTPTATWTQPPPNTPTQTPTLTPTQPSGQVNLVPYQRIGWDGPMVVSGVPGTNTSGGLVGGQPTYMDLAFLNEGPGDAFFPAGTARVEVLYDSQHMGWYLTEPDPRSLPAGWHLFWEDVQIGSIPAGQHSLTMVVDPDNVVAETNETDNEYTFVGTWSAADGVEPTGPPTIRYRSHGPLASDGTRMGSGDRSPAELEWKRTIFQRLSRGPAAPDVSLLVQGEPVYVPAAAHVAGAAGTNWRTDVELHNPGTTQGQYEIALLRRDQANTSPQTVVYTVAPGRCLRLNDVMFTSFGVEGGAALRITPVSGELMVTSRTYNLTDDGTYGQFIGGSPQSTAIGFGDVAVLIQLSQHQQNDSGYRTNLGFTSATGSTIDVRADLYHSDGSLIGTRYFSLAAFTHKQVDRIFRVLTNDEVADGYIVLSTSTPGGRFFAYASVVDNATGDPVYIPATVLGEVGPPPTPTPTPTTTSPPGTPTATPTPTPTVGIPLPFDPLDAMQQIFIWLGTVPGQGGNIDLEGVVAQAQTEGFQSLLNAAADHYPDVVTAGTNSIQMDFGAGWMSPDGYWVTGSAQVQFSNVNVNAPNASLDWSGTTNGIQVDGIGFTIETASGETRMSTDSEGHVQGNMSFSGSGSTPKRGLASLAANVDVDTLVCRFYPVGGEIVYEDDGGVHRFTFDPDCDGEFIYVGPGGTGDLAFRLRWDGPQDLDLYVRDPFGEVIYYGNPVSASGGQLDVDANAGCSGPAEHPTENIYWEEGTAPSGTYDFWAQRWSDCGATPTPDLRLLVIVDGVIVRDIPLVMPSGGVTEAFYHTQ
jgi:hypothetical protein